MLEENAFVHLHLHSEYSLLDGAIRITDIPRLAKEAGHTAVALTDHGNMYGAVAFFCACVKEGIKPILGCEVYVAPKSRLIKTADRESNYYHLVLLVENETGYKNLTALVSRGYTEGFYGKPRVDGELLEQYHEGLICLSACLGGYIPSLLSRGDYEGAKQYALWLDSVFGSEHVYLEMQDHGMAEQKSVNRSLRKLAKETGLPLVVTNDAHYPRRTDADIQSILMCIQTNTTVSEGRPLGFETDEFYYKSTGEMEALFPEDEEALRNTGRIAERCHFAFQFDKLYLPVFETPDGTDAPDYLHRLALEGFAQKIADGSLVLSAAHPEEEYRERIAYEWRVICEMGYAEYYLIVWDFIHYAKSEGIPVGPGRGSGAGSLIAYLIGITDVDSIKYQLMFERFLNPERVSMPDFDIDFCDTRRGEVIEYVKRRYGEDHVAQIVTFGTLAARAAVRDVGRALGMPYAEVDAVAKAIPQDLHMTLDRALEQKELRDMYDGSPTVKNLIDTAKALEGMPRHASTHAAGVVITDRPVMEYVPLAENGGMVVTQFDMDTVAALGLLKIDFLGLRYLTVIADTEAQIREHTPSFQMDKVPFNDTETYAMIGQGKTLGVFQLESGGMRNMLMQLVPENLEMIVAAISLYRPGPMDSIPKFLYNRQHPTEITYTTPLLEDILDVTFGCIVYQEQVMQICRTVAGYSYARADLVRRAMAKKKTDVMEEERQAFLYGQKDKDGNVINTGALSSGMTEETAGALFDDMASFAKYAFNKSHATAYAYTAYRTAYLKRHYPGEYFSALLTSVNGSMNKTAEYIAEAQHMHLSILAPDINESAKYYHVAEKNGQKCIRYGLLAVKNVGVQFVSHIIEERGKRPFSDFEDFVARMTEQQDCPRRPVEALIKCGAFDALPQKRSQLFASFEQLIDQYADRARTAVTGQLDLFSAASEAEEPASVSLGQAQRRMTEGFRYPDIPEFSGRELLLMERDATGQCFSGHLLDDYKEHLSQLHPTEISEILASFEEADGEDEPGFMAKGDFDGGTFADGKQVAVAGIVSKRISKQTKRGDQMAFITLEDRYAEIEVILFPKVLSSCTPYLISDAALYIVGTLSVKEEEVPKILAKTVLPLKQSTAFGGDGLPQMDGTGIENNGVSSTEPIAEESPAEKSTIVRGDTMQLQPSPMPQAAARVSKPVSETPFPPNARTLFLRVPHVDEGDERFCHAKNLAEIFVADRAAYSIAIVFYDEAEKKYIRNITPPIVLTPYVLLQFEELLGKENAILR